MRLFVAVETSPDVQAAASRPLDELKRRTEEFAPRARVTWVKPDHLHLTVRFIGHVDPAVSKKILTTLDHPIRVPGFELTIEGTGTFPPHRPPRVIWAGIAGSLDKLHEVEQEVRSRLQRVVPLGEERDYHPHLTLGRVKSPAGLRPAVVLQGLEHAVFGVIRVGAVTLFESRLSSTGPTYIPLRRTPLAPTS